MENITNNLLQVLLLLKNESRQVYLVGGCVRDHLIKKTPKDFDIVTDISIERINKIFLDNNWNVETTGNVFLVTNISKGGYNYEISNFRSDGKYMDGRRPSNVTSSDIYTDSLRRDFTVNALYYDVFTHEILDPIAHNSSQSGLEDIKNMTLRFIGRPKDRIFEDYLRIFRFYRFLAKGFKPDHRSLRACREFFNKSYRQTAPERVRIEIEKMIKEIL